MEQRDPQQFLTMKLHYAKFVATVKTTPRLVEINTIHLNSSKAGMTLVETKIINNYKTWHNIRYKEITNNTTEKEP